MPLTFCHSADPVTLSTSSGSVLLPQFVQEITPPCDLNPFLFNGHLQTAWTAYKTPGPPVHYKRRVFSSNNPSFPGTFAVDFVVSPPKPLPAKADDSQVEDVGLREDPTGVGHISLPPRTTYFTNEEFASLPSDDTKPLLITLHGLSGGSYEIYLRHVIAPLVAQRATSTQSTKGEANFGPSGGEWECLVVNSRGCAGSKITSSILYNARATWDIRQIVQWCREVWPNRPLYAVGYSLGANILANYLGEEGQSCSLRAAALVSNPWNLELSSYVLQSSWLGLHLYSKVMGENMKKLFLTHREAILSNNPEISEERVMKLRYLHEFDREIQGPTWGYPTESAYYRDASSCDVLLDIRVPTLALHAKDDPIAADAGVPYQEIERNPYIVLAASAGGGHLGWFELGGGRWHVKPVRTPPIQD
ncbi:AB-hydrolase YheT [Piedraia hortae CBS 480.64]|uniref:alcohol O-acetyltransferase n=1 Tax=Piedraia hortae CBS 480.64 TaxID=1314780 RepID=A0A6A7BTB5_9PEZI|nr:AB-hydrolase YheT [Piedraia hortae CBS 480.64]